MNVRKLKTTAPLLLVVALGMALTVSLRAQTPSNPADLPQRDGSHDFDFLIGDWKAHVRRLPDRLNKSSVWVEYDGISNHKKLLDSNANFEEFDVTPTRSFTLKRRRCASIILLRVSGASIFSISTRGLLVCLPWSEALAEIAVSFSIRRNTRVAPFLCAMSGSIFHPSRRAWSNLSRRTAARPGKSIGFASFRDKGPASNNA
jgi:hypothetical protein